MNCWGFLLGICVSIAAVFLTSHSILPTTTNNGHMLNTSLRVWNEDSEQTENQVLVLTILKDAQSWGKGRSFVDHLNIIESMNYSLSSISLGFLVSDEKEFQKMTRVLSTTEFTSRGYKDVTLIKKDFPIHIGRAERHNSRLQRMRRTLLARARNNLLMSALRDEPYVLWIDADIIKVPSGLLDTMINSGKDIITPRCKVPPDEEDYDQNAWQGPRTKPTPAQEIALDNGATFVPDQVKGITKHLSDFRREDPLKKKQFVQLDSVGGTVLFVKSAVHKQGVIFPTEYIVGTTWDRFGFDGIETEGICYLAKSIGAKCWGMPHVEVEHDSS